MDSGFGKGRASVEPRRTMLTADLSDHLTKTINCPFGYRVALSFPEP
jgi:hypothetical protein